jgi:aldose 1-epimerase
MAFTISEKTVTAGGVETTVLVLEESHGLAYAEVWPAYGFNCLRWKVRNSEGDLGDLLYCAPDWEQNPVPTRSGHPILFPFPNRINHGKFTFGNKEYQLPLNESSGTHAIHGFTPKNPWRVVEAAEEDMSASITGLFQLSKDLPESLHLWPADFIIKVTYTLTFNGLNVTTLIGNPDKKPLPWGLGFHPYFANPDLPDATADDMILRADANILWQSNEGIPTGRTIALPYSLDFRKPYPIGATVLDTLYGEAQPGSLAELSYENSLGTLEITASEQFRELLLFTPPHRKALAIEPYTCTTDAANLSNAGVDAGWRVLAPGAQASLSVDYLWRPGNR